MLTETVALLPMRHSSERIPGKNYRILGDRPLYHHVLETLLQTRSVTKVVIDTDSPVITNEVSVLYPEVILLERPQHLRSGDVPMNQVLLHDIQQVPASLYIQTHSTNPLLQAATIDRAIDAFLAAADTHDSLFSVTPLRARLWSEKGNPLNHDPEVLERTQDLKPIFQENSAIYIFPTDTITRYERRIGMNPLMFQIDRLEGWDIDEEAEFLAAKALLRSFTR